MIPMHTIFLHSLGTLVLGGKGSDYQLGRYSLYFFLSRKVKTVVMGSAQTLSFALLSQTNVLIRGCHAQFAFVLLLDWFLSYFAAVAVAAAAVIVAVKRKRVIQCIMKWSLSTHTARTAHPRGHILEEMNVQAQGQVQEQTQLAQKLGGSFLKKSKSWTWSL